MIVQATVTSNSSKDKYGRVSIKADGIWESTPPIPCAGGVWYKTGDIVYVYCDDNMANPLIIGRCMNSTVQWKRHENGQILWENVSDDGKWSVCHIDGGRIHIVNSEGTEVTIDGGDIQVKSATLSIDNSTAVSHQGSMATITASQCVGLIVHVGGSAIPVEVAPGAKVLLTDIDYNMTK